MKKNILITALPRSGKTTLLNKILQNTRQKVGLVTNEIRENGERVGFEIETSAGERSILAHVNFNTPFKVSRYFVDIKNLDIVLPKISTFTINDTLYLDEIGQMELYSEQFKKLVVSYLDSNNICIAILSEIYQDDFTDLIRKRKDVVIIKLTPENREEKAKQIEELLHDLYNSTQNASV